MSDDLDDCPEPWRSEIERLRAALREVVDFEASPDFTKWRTVIANARKALGGID